jgi:hypothetical protein
MAVGHKDTNREVEPSSQAPGAFEAAEPNRGDYSWFDQRAGK